jgi:hypothetical protein
MPPDVVPLRARDARFRGLSAVHLFAGGRTGLMLSDRGVLFKIAVERAADHRPTAVRLLAAHRLLGPNGKALPERFTDSEALAVTPDGRILIAFEGGPRGRILAYAEPGAVPVRIPGPPGIRALPGNQGLEALAVGRDGALYTLPEATPGPVFPVWRRDPAGAWTRAGRLPAADGFRPVAADLGDDGRLWVLERRLRAPANFASRIRRSPTGDLVAWETVLVTPDGAHGNLEGLSLWRDPGGRLRGAMVADDNFRAIQRSELVEYLLPD